MIDEKFNVGTMHEMSRGPISLNFKVSFKTLNPPVSYDSQFSGGLSTIISYNYISKYNYNRSNE